MKKGEFSFATCSLLLAVLFLALLQTPRVSPAALTGFIYADASGSVDLYSSKGGQGINQSAWHPFHPLETVTLYACVLDSNGSAVQDKLVGFSVEGPANEYNNITFYKVASTNASGIAVTSSRIPLPDEHAEDIVIGNWTAFAYVQFPEGVASDMMPFKVEFYRMSLTTDKQLYNMGENITITLLNISNETVHIGGYPAWRIRTYPTGEIVHPYSVATLLWDLAPGENDTLVWDQYNQYTGNYCSAGVHLLQDTQGWGITVYFRITMQDVIIPGDVDGNLRVDMSDIVLPCGAFGSMPGHPRWDPVCDLDSNERIDMSEIVTACVHFGQHYP